MVFELLFLSYGKRLVRTDHLGEYFSRYSFKLLATCLAPSSMSGFLPWLFFHFNNWDIRSLSIRLKLSFGKDTNKQ